jgi:two-component system, OmpR family, sensor kinase
VDNRIAELRRALGDDPACPRWIATVPGQGYRVRRERGRGAMTTPASVTRWRPLVPIVIPVLAGAALGVALQVAEPAIQLYASVAPGLLVGVAGLLATVVLAAARLTRQRAMMAAEAAERDAMVQAANDRLRFLMQLDHELKNPLTREIETVPVDLPGLLQEVGEAVAAIPAAGERDIQWSVPQAPWPLPVIEGDRDLLFIALQNLIANAVKFSAPGDRVEVRSSEDDDWVLLEVADTGIGIPEEEIGEVWQELARGRAARSLPGTGIGLALVRVVVTRHGGRIAIRSRDGQGTVVSIRLPVQGRPGTGTPVAGLRQHRDSRGTVPA